MTLAEKRPLTKRDENNVVKRVCRHCRRQFNCGRALGAHMKVHNNDRKKTTITRKQPRSKIITNTTNSESENTNIDLRNSLSHGWKLSGKRGSNSVNDDDGEDYLNGGNVYAVDDEHDNDDDEDEEEDVNEDGFNVMQVLRNHGFRDNAHRIAKTRSVFICKTCDMRFPTFHAVLVHVNDHEDSSNATIDGENIMGVHSEQPIDDGAVTVDGEAISAVLEATNDDVVFDDQKEVSEKMDKVEDLEVGDKETEGGDANKESKGEIVTAVVEDGVEDTEEEKVGTQVEDAQVHVDEAIVDQNASTSNPRNILDFDLNELPPNED